MQYSSQHFFKAETLYGRFSTVRRAPASFCEENWGFWSTERMQQGWGKGKKGKGKGSVQKKLTLEKTEDKLLIVPFRLNFPSLLCNETAL